MNDGCLNNMKGRNQQIYTSELDAKEKLIVYVYEYLIHSGARQAAETFKESIGYAKDIKVNEGPSFLLDWWCVFWDLYCAAPERRQNQPESSSDARAFHDLMRSTPTISPSIAQPSPTQSQIQHHPGLQHHHQNHQHPLHHHHHHHHQQQQQLPPQHFMGGPRFVGSQHPGHHSHHRVPGPNRMHGLQHQQLQQHGAHHLGQAQHAFMQAADNSPRYQHSGHAGHPHLTSQANPMFGGLGPEQLGPSPGLNRMTPVGGSQQSNGPNIQMMASNPQMQQQMNANQQGVVGQQQMTNNPPPRNGSQGNASGWQTSGSSINYSVNSPVTSQSNCFAGPGSDHSPSHSAMTMLNDSGLMDMKNSPIQGSVGEPSTPHSEDYVLPVSSFSQESNDQSESAEILKLKQSMQEDATKMFEKEQSDGYLGDFSDSQSKWT